ncbi:unnamed protein product [Amoebophrya sp. A25]|nr:unnamed protein product [Amoebophrya sp. A25]|eukprot:GSA25T00026569001.1
MGTMSEVDSREAAQYARQGFYTLAVAMREVDSAFVRQVVGGDLFSAGKASSDSTEEVMLRRSDVEKDMRFLGLFLFANAVKSDSACVIRQFQDASILPQIITGDNIYAAGSVAARCGFFDGESSKT